MVSGKVSSKFKIIRKGNRFTLFAIMNRDGVRTTTLVWRDGAYQFDVGITGIFCMSK